MRLRFLDSLERCFKRRLRLLAFDRDVTTESAFSRTAEALRVPLKIVHDSDDHERTAYEAKYILVRPDRYIAWAANSPPADAAAILAKAVARLPA